MCNNTKRSYDCTNVHVNQDTTEIEMFAIWVTFFLPYFSRQFFFLNVSICLGNSNETFVYNSYVYRDIDAK